MDPLTRRRRTPIRHSSHRLGAWVPRNLFLDPRQAMVCALCDAPLHTRAPSACAGSVGLCRSRQRARIRSDRLRSAVRAIACRRSPCRYRLRPQRDLRQLDRRRARRARPAALSHFRDAHPRDLSGPPYRVDPAGVQRSGRQPHRRRSASIRLRRTRTLFHLPRPCHRRPRVRSHPRRNRSSPLCRGSRPGRISGLRASCGRLIICPWCRS